MDIWNSSFEQMFATVSDTLTTDVHAVDAKPAGTQP